MTSLLKAFRPLQLTQSALLLALSASLLGIVWSNYIFFSSDLQAPVSTPTDRLSKNNDTTTVYGVKDIESWRVFGVHQESKEHNYEDIKKTNLSIKLFGTFFNEKGILSAAIVSLNEELPMLVTKNSKISPNVQLKQVMAQSIVIDNNGNLEKVKLSDFESVLGLGEKEEKSELKDGNDSPDEDAPQTARERALEKYGLEPVAKDSASGYRITDDAKEITEKFNLSPGDIILSVNGYPVGENDSDTLAVKSFQDSGSASVTVNQSGTTTVIEYKR